MTKFSIEVVMEYKNLKKTVLSRVDPELAEKFLETLNEFLENNQDKEQKAKLSSIFLEIYRKLLVNFAGEEEEDIKFFLRYCVLEDFISGENINKVKNFDVSELKSIEGVDYPVLYVDEWINLVNYDEIPSSAGDDLTKMKKTQNPAEKMKEFLDKHSNEKRNLEKIVVLRQSYITTIQKHWKKIISTLITKDDLESVNFENKIKNESDISKILELMPKLTAVNKRISGLLNQMKMAAKTINSLKGDVSAEDLEKVKDQESSLVVEEYKSIKQMGKMCIGRQGNEFPILYDPYFPVNLLDRDRVKEYIEKIQFLDPDIFFRKFLGIDSNNPPFTLLAPVYGKRGVCWEAIPKQNRETGRGKIAIPLFPAVDEEQIVIRALADYRWQKMKEVAGFRWMNEGLTGRYYEIHEAWKADKKKGKKVKFNTDLKDSFIENYILWIKYESQGMQKVDKEVRQIFWLHMPFPEEVKKTLKDRGFHYKQLYENDQRKAMSQGY
ncbi:MAG: hypothetical protein ACQESP_04195 [Candidatus Muiribacteriota bacterium]